ncbi:MAG: imidazole glycerol phosphate synthase subunit HisH [Acidobacteriota bacterium]
MSRRAVIVDTGVGNLGNLVRALRAAGAAAEISRDPTQVAASRCLVLPGVGAFAPPREALRGELEAALRHSLQAGAWLLGVCVGYQLLFEVGEEFGETDGLALLPGRVTALPTTVPRPHIGWNRLRRLAASPLLAGLEDGASVYFVHSFAPQGVPSESCLAECLHGRSFAAMAGRGRIAGTQFHPEKSGAVGLRLLTNFVEMAHGTAAVD